METSVTLNRIASHDGQHDVDDAKEPTCYEVLVDGVKVGEVFTRSKRNRYASKNSRFLGRTNGFTRSWHCMLVGSRFPLSHTYASTRAKAVEALLTAVADRRK